MARADKDEELAISFYGIGGEGKTCTLHKLEDEIHEVEHGKPIEDVKKEILRLTAMGISQRGIAASVVSRKLV